MPIAALLILMRRGEQARFIEMTADQLQADRQPLAEARGQADGRQTGEIHR